VNVPNVVWFWWLDFLDVGQILLQKADLSFRVIHTTDGQPARASYFTTRADQHNLLFYRYPYKKKYFVIIIILILSFSLAGQQNPTEYVYILLHL
jgi:hypothetical protein